MLSKRKARSLKYGDVVGGWEGLIFEEMSRGREQLTVVVIFIKLPVHRRSLIAKRWTVVIHVVVVVVVSFLNQSVEAASTRSSVIDLQRITVVSTRLKSAQRPPRPRLS